MNGNEKLSFLSRYAPIEDALQEVEKRMNRVLLVAGSFFGLISLLYFFRWLAVNTYDKDDPTVWLYYYQGHAELGSFLLLTTFIILTATLGKKYPKFPRYAFLFIFIEKAVVGSIFLEVDMEIMYVVPVLFAIGFYNVRYSIMASFSAMVSYVAAQITSAYCGIPDLNFYYVDKYEETAGLNVYYFNPVGYVNNVTVGNTVPIAVFLLIICIAGVFLTKGGADMLLRENVVSRAKAAMDRELSLGNEIQQSMLPDRVYESEHYSAYSYMVSAKNVGGDFLDYFEVDEKRVLVAIGDVSGKGLSASLFSSNTKALLSAYARSGFEPNEILQCVNESLCTANKKKLFVTIWVGLFDTATGELTYCNAGHNPPLIKTKNGDTRFLDGKPNFIVGRRRHIVYTQHHLYLSEGDAVVLYTDGVTEALNKQGEFYGDERLLAFTKENDVMDGFTKKLRKNIFTYKGEAEQSDDISIVCLRFNKKKIIDRTERQFKATQEEYPRLCTFVRGFVEKYTQSIRTMNDIEMCLCEIFSNINFYSSEDKSVLTDVSVILSYTDGMLTIRFEDNGIPFNPLTAPTPSLEENRKAHKLGGFGIFLVKKLTDEVTYDFENQKNILTLKKKIQEETL